MDALTLAKQYVQQYIDECDMEEESEDVWEIFNYYIKDGETPHMAAVLVRNPSEEI